MYYRHRPCYCCRRHSTSVSVFSIPSLASIIFHQEYHRRDGRIVQSFTVHIFIASTSSSYTLMAAYRSRACVVGFRHVLSRPSDGMASKGDVKHRTQNICPYMLLQLRVF